MSGSDAQAGQRSVGGGYDDGYSSCPRFWPDRPGSVLSALDHGSELHGLKVLDLGGGEGTNASWLEKRSCSVTVVEVSAAALKNAHRLYPSSSTNWIHADATSVDFADEQFDLVIAYGLLHCLDEPDIEPLVSRMKRWTSAGGLNVVVAFNNRSQDLRAHPGFAPTLLDHGSYANLYSDWQRLIESDEDLFETHPHNGIPHHHSMTRLASRKPLHVES